MALRCIAIPGYICVSATRPQIVPPVSTAIINRGYTPDALSGTRSVATGPTDRLGVVTLNYNVVTTGTKKASCQTFSANTFSTQEIVFRGSVTFASGSTVLGLGNNIKPTDAGTTANGESIIGNFGGTLLNVKTLADSGITATVNSDIVTFGISSVSSTSSLTISNSLSVTGVTTLSRASIVNGLTVSGDLTFVGRINNYDLASVFSAVATTTGGLLVGSGSGTLTSLAPSSSDRTSNSILTINSANPSGLGYSIGSTTLNNMMPTYFGSTGYQFSSGDLIMSTGNLSNHWKPFHPSTNGFLYNSDTGPDIIPGGRLYTTYSTTGAISNCSVMTNALVLTGANPSLSIPFTYCRDPIECFKIGGVSLTVTNNILGMTLAEDSTVAAAQTDGAKYHFVCTYITSNIVLFDLQFKITSFNETNTSYTISGGGGAVVNQIPPPSDLYFINRYYRYDGNPSDISLLLGANGSVILNRVNGYWPSLVSGTVYCNFQCYYSKV